MQEIPNTSSLPHLQSIVRYILSLPPLLLKPNETPDLADFTLFPSKQFIQSVLNRTERHPQLWEPLANYASQRALGRYFERFVLTTLRYGFPHHQISSNVQLPQKPSIGELDFVISSFAQTLHLEVAIKFYLFLPSKDPTNANFYGSQLRDRLDLKLDKLIQKQLRHEIPVDVSSPIATATLRRVLWLTGMLCYPVKDYLNQNFPNFTAMGLNPTHRKGWWSHVGDLSQAFAADERLFLPLTKHQWLDPLDHVLLGDVTDLILQEDDLQSLKEPQFVLRFAEDGRKLDRGFIAPHLWASEIILD